ncbi:MAG: PorT family protein [Candidatus Aminicenantes bacterium]|nr:MAG: PorT family protein [Candidatus Aminicenantes bacterium]
MKKTFLCFIMCTALFIFFNNALGAEVGIKGGTGFFKTTTGNYLFGVSAGQPEVKSIISFQVGAFYSIDIAKNLVFQPEIYYVIRGTRASKFIDTSGEEYRATLKIEYIDIPVLVKYIIPWGNRIKPILFAGPYIGFRLNAAYFDEFFFRNTTEMDGKVLTANQYLGMVVGGGFEFNLKSMKLTLEGRFSFGLSSMHNPNVVHPPELIYGISNYPTDESFVFMLGIGI